ncbi:MAG: 3-deoxy-D-manno-octulosonic acid transferase [Prevotellaceae bacterium]|jgi:3-deoxy-D-manno-octulosonic-acid transferase|nr:3-deoxy-D-manno-octulosonic acid transferase [Prevotellaceae bacterium]
MNILYNIAILCYGRFIALATLFNAKARLLRNGQADSFAVLNTEINKNGEYTWFHSASLGEFEQGRPVIEALKRNKPEIKILLTFFSPSGYEIRKRYDKADVVVYLPLDTKKNARKFLQTVPLKQAVFIKYEFWPNYLQALFRSNIPVYSISAIFRPRQLFFKPYGKWYLNLLSGFTRIFVQDTPSFELLQQHRIKQVTVAGDTRFDRVLEIRQQAKKLPVIEAFRAGKKMIVAGSVWPQDEKLLVQYADEHPDVKMVIVPHEIHRSHLDGLSALLKNNFITYSTATPEQACLSGRLVVDAVGFLSSIYQYADVAYIGGGFGVGIHNTLEAAVYGIPVVFGRNFQKFREARELIEIGGAFSITDYESLKTCFDLLLTDAGKAGTIAGEYVKNNAGATGKIIKELTQ